MNITGKIAALKYYFFLYFKKAIDKVLWFIPLFRKIQETRGTQTPILFKYWFWQRVLRMNPDAYWPVHRTSNVQGCKKIYCGIETCPGYMSGCYIQASNKIYIGDYTQMGPNVSIHSSNHDFYDNRIIYNKGEIHIGKYCWLGSGAQIMSGVKLGDFTVVAANTVVTKSFEDGYCVLAGTPAKIIKHLEKEKCVRHKSPIEYNGYIPSKKFEKFRKKNLLC